MTPEYVAKVRRERWRQADNPLLTLDDAERWLVETSLCLFLPRRAHLPVPAPSFTEAVVGKSNNIPDPAAIVQARTMLARLVASAAAVPLNLFGTPGEQPDFLATPDALPYLYAMQAERNPKKAPSTSGSGRVSQLAVTAWTLLETEGAHTAEELREKLGREVTEAAVIRSLGELWQTMRVMPVPDEGEGPATWELLSARHRKELNAGSTESQATALSMLVSFYLQSAIVATSEEAELFLSPLASRSRVRDVVRSLSATRQLQSVAMEAQTHYFVEGTLPEMPDEREDERAKDQGLEGNEPDIIEIAGRETNEGGEAPLSPPGQISRGRISRFSKEGGSPRRPVREGGERRPAFGGRTALGDRGKRPSFGDRNKPAFGTRPRSAPAEGTGSGEGREGSGSAQRSSFGARRPAAGGFRKPGADRPSFRAKSPDERRERPADERSPVAGSSDRPHSNREGGALRPFQKFGAGAGRPGRRPAGGERGSNRPSFGRREGGFSQKPGGFGSGPDRGGSRSIGGRGRPQRATGGEEGRPPRREFSQGSTGSPPLKDRGADRNDRSSGPSRPPRQPIRAGGDRSSRPSFGSKFAGKKPFGARGGPGDGGGFKRREAGAGGNEARPFTRKPAGDAGRRGGPSERPARSFDRDRPRRDAGDRPPRAGNDRPFTPRSDRQFTPRGDRPFNPRSSRPDRPAGDRPYRPRTENRGENRTEGDSRSPRTEGGSGERRSFSGPKGGVGSFSRGPASRGPGSKGPDRGDFKPRSPSTRSGAGQGRTGVSGPPRGGARPGAKPGGFRPGGSRPGGSRPGGGSRPTGGKPGNGPRSGPGGRPGGFAPPRRKLPPRRPDDGEGA